MRTATSNQEITIFVGSHFHDCGLFRLKPTIKEEEVEEPLAKRPRLSSGDLTRKKKVITQAYEPLQLLDSLPVLSGITDTIQLPPVAGVVDNSQLAYSKDFLVSSGNHIKSYLTIATSSIPLDGKPLPLKLKLGKNETPQLTRVSATTNFVVASFRISGPEKRTGTYVMEVKDGGKMIPVDAERAGFVFDEETIAAFDTKKAKFVV